MKKLAIFLILITTLLFSQTSGATNIKYALQNLEDSAKGLLGIMVLFCSVPLALIFIVALIAFFIKRNDPTKKWLLYVAIASLIISIGLVVFYLLVPVIIKTLVGPGAY